MTGSLALLVIIGGWVLTAMALYWIVRLAVSHGVQDAARAGAAPRHPDDAPQVSDVIWRQHDRYGDA